MSNKFFSLLVCLSLLAPALLRAEGDEYAPYLNPPSRGVEPLVTNQPVLGRIFGVHGSGADIKHYVFDLSRRTPRSAAIRSALVPGWGQSFNNEKGKGLLFFVTTTALAVGSVLRYSDARHSYNDYKDLGSKSGSLYDDYEDERVQALAMGGAALVLYTFGIIDAYRRAYNPLYSANPSVKVALAPTEGRIVWSQKF
jgi:hypothetical protein